MFKSVKEYFEAEYPQLVSYLKTDGRFWPSIKDNTITNAELVKLATVFESRPHSSDVTLATIAMMAGRLLGKISNPG